MKVEPRRHVELHGCCNFRDLGGYPTRDGRRTRWRRLFRADGLAELSDEDVATLGELGVRLAIDLRTDLEVEERGRLREDIAAIAYHHLPLTDTLPGAEQTPAWHDSAFVSARYRSMLSDGESSVALALELLAAEGNLPAVFHCSVGKDRTGVLAAVVLGVLGVPDEVIVEDYTLSKTAMEQILARLHRDYPDAAEVVASFAPVILSVEPASMTGFLHGVHERYGGFDSLAEALGIVSAVERLRVDLLE